MWKIVIVVVLFGEVLGEQTKVTYEPELPTTNLPEFSIPCKVPGFVKVLPISMRRQLRRIWSGVPVDGDCYKQLAATRELINTLPMSMKLKIAEYTEIEDKFRANFFSELLPEEKTEFGDVLKNLTMTAEEKVTYLKEWGKERLSLAAYENYEAYLDTFLKRDQRFTLRLKKLSPEAREAYIKIQDIRRQKQALLAQLSESAKAEIASLFKSECSATRPRMQMDTPEGEDHHDFLCLGVPVKPVIDYATLTRSYGRNPPPTTSLPSESSEELQSAGQRIIHLLLQRVHYLKPYFGHQKQK
uniref:SXP/RAL-2 family protein Ani s 5-like cation-binding domain-containing protein n=1 Tax=Panagrellus redivivus TaxID=6233 RepID=A0A7E4ZTY4_PANRE